MKETLSQISDTIDEIKDEVETDANFKKTINLQDLKAQIQQLNGKIGHAQDQIKNSPYYYIQYGTYQAHLKWQSEQRELERKIDERVEAKIKLAGSQLSAQKYLKYLTR